MVTKKEFNIFLFIYLINTYHAPALFHTPYLLHETNVSSFPSHLPEVTLFRLNESIYYVLILNLDSSSRFLRLSSAQNVDSFPPSSPPPQTPPVSWL